MAVAIIDGARTGFAKIASSLKNENAVSLGVKSVNALASKYSLSKRTDGLVVFGTVIQHADISNIAREVVLESDLNPMTQAFTTIMACATSLSGAAEAASWISRGRVPWAIAGGSESMSNFPVSYPKGMGRALRDFQYSKDFGGKARALMQLRPSSIVPQVPEVTERLTGLSMGEHCELMAKEWKISREEQDQWAVESHKKAAAAKSKHEGFIVYEKDNIVRGETSVEKISRLQPAFSSDGTLTAANSSPLTDGGAAVLLADEDFARKQGWPILAILDDFEASAVDIKTEGLLMAPPYAILRLLKRQQKALADFDLVDIHEAFAAQVLCNLKALGDNTWAQSRVGVPATTLPSRDRMNVWGGSVSLGHPFAATGARLLMQQAKCMQETKAKTGLISICAAGGLGLIATLRGA